MSYVRCFLVVCIISICSLPSLAQRSSNISRYNYWGVELGLTGSSLDGASNFFYSYSYPYLDPGSGPIAVQLPFQSLGSGLGFHIGGLVDFRLSDMFGLVGKLNFHTNHTGATNTMQYNCVSADGSSSELVTRTTNYSQTLEYLTLDVLLRWQITPDEWYLLGGLGSSSLVGNTFSGSDQVDAGSIDCQFLQLPSRTPLSPSVRQIPIQSGSISDYYNTNREAFKIGVGTNIPLSAGMVLSPELVASIPLTPLFNSNTESIYSQSGATTPKLYAVTLSVALKFPFGGGSSSDYTSSESTSNGSSSSASNSGMTNGMVHLRGKVTDANGKPVNANVTVTDLNSNEVVQSGHTDDGNYDFPVKAPGKYSVTADADGYLFGSAYFEVDDQGRILKGKHDIALSPATGRTRLLVFFDFDKADLQPESYPELSHAISLMKSNPSMQVEIAGYTDSKGSDEYNIDLSQRRANSVKEYLVKHGIDKRRVTARGYGKADPIASNDTDEGRAENRRVEFVVVKR